MQGTTDIQINLVDERRLAAADRHAKIALIDGMNRILVDAPADRVQNLATYGDPSLRFIPASLRRLQSFYKARRIGTRRR